jgi:hypothetical protein
MNTLLRAAATLAATITLLTPAARVSAAASALPKGVPADAEVVASLNARQLIDSPPVQKIIAKLRATKGLDDKVALLRNLSGIDVLKDIDRISIFGRIEDDEYLGVHVDGRVDEEKLLTLLKADNQVRTTAIAGQEVYEWMDKKEKRQKYGAFLDGGTVAVWNSKRAAEAALAARADEAKAFGSTPEAALVPEGAASASAWLVVASRRDGQPLDKIKAKSVAALLNVTTETVDLKARLNATTPEAGAQWIAVVNGLAAFAQLQSENADLQRLGAAVRTTLSEDHTAMTADITVKVDDIVRIIEEGHKKKQTEKAEKAEKAK